jgi:hypothetical protein
MPRVTFDKFAVRVPSGWNDITPMVEADDPPYTLAHEDGVGALQFSVALYESGPIPDPTPAVLKEMVEEFGRKRGLGEPSAVICETGQLRLAAGSFAWGEDFLRVWQVSDGRSFAFITYTCAVESARMELASCERIVRSIVFNGEVRVEPNRRCIFDIQQGLFPDDR